MNRKRREEAGKVFLDISKYLATTVAISGLLGKDKISWLIVAVGIVFSVCIFVIGIKIIPSDKEE